MSRRPELDGVHHLKLPVSDLAASLRFYEAALGAERIAAADHRRESDGSLYAYLATVEGLGTLLELRLDPSAAAAHRHFDPITIAVTDHAALQRWDEYLTERGLLHSPVITAIRSWVLVVEHPDGNRIRLYSIETHGPELRPDEDNPWVRVQPG